MKLHAANSGKAKAFTLIEMIGVLAVIAILAALLVPKVFSAINDARVSNACVSIETIKTATADHYGKYGKLNCLWGTNDLAIASITNYANMVLLTEELIDKPFSVKIGGGDPSTNSVIALVAGDPTPGNPGGYALDGGTVSSTANAAAVIEAVIYGVTAQDAKDLNDRIDGQAMGAAVGQEDKRGRVQYAAGTSTTVYVYITHR
jgi:prepilin-type N-terminal cleavage/methylation domain-containing protein